MAATIPTIEPTAPRAGDSWQWTRALPDYPASSWTLTYTAWNATAAFSLVATAAADGSTHSIRATPAATAAHSAGRYDWVARVSDGTDTFTVATGIWRILPAVGSAQDSRSHARKMLDAINALLEGRASDGDLDVVRTGIGDHATQYDPAALIKLRQQYAAAVASEDSAAALARGDQSGRIIRTRFL